jgi:hypothetical protein
MVLFLFPFTAKNLQKYLIIDKHHLQTGCIRVTWGALKNTEAQTERSPGQDRESRNKSDTLGNLVSAKGGTWNLWGEERLFNMVLVQLASHLKKNKAVVSTSLQSPKQIPDDEKYN